MTSMFMEAGHQLDEVFTEVIAQHHQVTLKAIRATLGCSREQARDYLDLYPSYLEACNSLQMLRLAVYRIEVRADELSNQSDEAAASQVVELRNMLTDLECNLMSANMPIPTVQQSSKDLQHRVTCLRQRLDALLGENT